MKEPPLHPPNAIDEALFKLAGQLDLAAEPIALDDARQLVRELTFMRARMRTEKPPARDCFCSSCKVFRNDRQLGEEI